VADRFHVIAHRGGAGYAPENTLAAFERARALGVREVELDVRASRDGELVLFHDDRLDAKTSLSGRVVERDAAELLEAEIGHWFDASHPEVETPYAGTRLATLGQLLDRFGTSLDYHVELKGTGRELPERVLATLRERAADCACVITSFSFDDLVRIVERDAAVRVCLLLRDARGWASSLPARRRELLVASQCERVARAAAAGFAMVGVRASTLLPELVQHSREHGVELRVWGIESDAELEHAIAVGAGGATIDWPLVLLERLRARGIEPAEGALG
jgi:glycerophosphoryl diester phosphodiesterase